MNTAKCLAIAMVSLLVCSSNAKDLEEFDLLTASKVSVEFEGWIEIGTDEKSETVHLIGKSSSPDFAKALRDFILRSDPKPTPYLGPLATGQVVIIKMNAGSKPATLTLCDTNIIAFSKEHYYGAQNVSKDIGRDFYNEVLQKFPTEWKKAP